MIEKKTRSCARASYTIYRSTKKKKLLNVYNKYNCIMSYRMYLMNN